MSDETHGDTAETWHGKDYFMITAYYLGTCSGTEPIAGMHHTAFVLNVAGQNYWFDAGECCGYTAHLKGIDVLKTRAIFISHPHNDHIGGLPHLLMLIGKLIAREGRNLPCDNSVDIFFPGLKTLECVKGVCNGWENREKMSRYELIEHEMREGLLFEDGNVRVSTIHNRHLKEDGTQGWHSFSFLIEAEGKRIVFSGDVAESSELDELLGDGCDLLIHETGHHSVESVCRYAACHDVKALRFIHHGREIINDRDKAELFVEKFAQQTGISVGILSDGDSETL